MNRTTLFFAAITAVLSTSFVNAQYRTFNGTLNNEAHPTWGSASANFLRLDPTSHYDDGISTPRENSLANARDISNALGFQPTSMPDPRKLSDFVWQWGQFLDHDITLTPSGTEFFPITVNDSNDPLTPMIPMMRSDYDLATGTSTANPRQQYNANTAFVDASMVYGSDDNRAKALRTHSGGRLNMSAGDLLMRNTMGLDNANAGPEPNDTLFLAGDVRANEQLGLIAMHTLFAREHNRLADKLAARHPSWNDEQIYQQARKMVGGIVQHITYQEYLPALTGETPMQGSVDYDATVNPGIWNEFATAIFRLGHTQVSESLLRIDNAGNPAPGGAVPLADAFFVPSAINSQEIDYLLKGLASQMQQTTDQMMNETLRNSMFGPPGAGGLDLLAINIQRGRDHGLPTYVEMQQRLGLPVATTFADITSDPTLQAELELYYGEVANVELWIGALTEEPMLGSAVGPMIQKVIQDQFKNLMVGDSFFYLWDSELSELERSLIESSTLADVILRNTPITNLQSNVFFVPEPTGIQLVALSIGLLLLAKRRRG